ncbi:hypothetical protein LB450_08595 [Psychroflexus sp. CAK1W]|nr:hypothetical protein [Psychroflexus curvus]MBZ9628154.1 hypothetical protein [Psychroflexus curvus]
MKYNNFNFIDWVLKEIPKPAHRKLTKDEKFQNKENIRLRKLIEEKNKRK